MPQGKHNNLGTTFGGPLPLKFGRAKNVQNLAQFLTNLEFDREYLQNGLRYQKSKKQVINYSQSHVKQKSQ